MKKAVKISLIVLITILILGLVALYIYRNPFVSYALQKIILSKSHQKVTLTLDKVEFDPFGGSISLYKPNLNFSEAFLNDKKVMQLNSLSFEKLGIYKVSVFDLLFEEEFIADEILLLKPAIAFKKMAGTVDTNHFSPEKLINLLNTNSKTFTKVKLKVNEIKIDFGAIHFQLDTVSKYIPELLDFTLLLKKFETQIDPDISTKNRILYSDDVILRIKNINKQLKAGYNLHIDSVSYSSKSERLSSDGLQLTPIWKTNDSTNKLQLSIPIIRLDGLSVSEIRGLEKLHLRALNISDAALVHYTFDKTTAPPENETDSLRTTNLPEFLKTIGLDSLIVNHFTFYNVSGKTDTSIAANNIALLIRDITFDSTLLDNPQKNLHLGSILLGTDAVHLLEPQEGIALNYDHFTYSSISKQLNLRAVQLLSDSLVFPGPQFHIDLSALQIDSFSVQDFLQKKKQILGLKLNQPTIYINFIQEKTQQKSASAKKKNELLDLLSFQNLSITNGQAQLRNGDKFSVDITGINLLTNGLEIIDQDTAKQLNYDSLHIKLDGLKAILGNGDTHFQSSAVLLNDGNFELNEFHANYRQKQLNKKVSGTLGLKKFRATDIDLTNLLFNKQFNAAFIILDKPVLHGTYPLPSTKGLSEKDSGKSPANLPIRIQIGECRLQQGKADVVLEKPGDTIHVVTNLDLNLGKIRSSDTSLFHWVSPTDWEGKFNTLAIASVAYELEVNDILFNPRKDYFSLDELTLLSKPHPKHKENKVEFEQLILPNISLSGLDYALLLSRDSIHFSKLLIDNPILNVKLFSDKTKQQEENQAINFPTAQLLGIVYDSIDLNNLTLNLEKNSDSSHEIIKVGSFSIEQFSHKSSNNNLLPKIAFQLDNISIEDSIKHTALHLYKMAFNPKLETLDIQKIDWRKTDRKNNNKLAFNSTEITLSGSYVEETLPSKIKFNTLRLADLDITVSNNKSEGNQRKEELEFNIKALKKYSGLLSHFSIDTTVLDDVSIHYKTIDGTQEHTIQADSIGLIVNRIHIDSSMFDDTNPILIENISIDLKGRTRISKDSIYDIKTGWIHYNFPEHRITVDSFYVIPRYDEATCFRKAKYQKGIISLYVKKIELNDLRLNELMNSKPLHFGGIDVHEMKFDIVKDKKYPIEPGRYKPMPQELIRGITQKLQIDSLRIYDSYLYFKLYPEKKTNTPGEIMLTDLNASAYNITNIFNASDSNILQVSLNARIMDESRMDANFFFPLQDTSNRWWFNFKTEKIDFTHLNSMTQHLVGLTVLSGKGTVDAPLISGDDYNTSGQLLFRYKNIRLSLYNRKSAETETGIFNTMANFLINDLVIKSNNPKFVRKPKVGIVYAQRDTKKGIVNFAFKSILSGMLSTLGINKKEQRKVRRDYKKIDKQRNWKSF